jgi:hypothetical protein
MIDERPWNNLKLIKQQKSSAIKTMEYLEM